MPSIHVYVAGLTMFLPSTFSMYVALLRCSLFNNPRRGGNVFAYDVGSFLAAHRMSAISTYSYSIHWPRVTLWHALLAVTSTYSGPSCLRCRHRPLQNPDGTVPSMYLYMLRLCHRATVTWTRLQTTRRPPSGPHLYCHPVPVVL